MNIRIFHADPVPSPEALGSGCGYSVWVNSGCGEAILTVRMPVIKVCGACKLLFRFLHELGDFVAVFLYYYRFTIDKIDGYALFEIDHVSNIVQVDHYFFGIVFNR